MKILVTGGSGFIGSHLCEKLIDEGHHVTSLDDYSTSNKNNLESLIGNQRFQSIKGSILDRDLVESLIHGTDICFHFAAAVGVQKILDDPIGSLKTNLIGSENIIELCSNLGKKLLLASTSEIYGKNQSQPLTEESDRVLGSPLLSRWTYSEAKAIDEALARAYFDKYGLKMKIVRLFNTVGPRQSPAYGMVIPRFFKAALHDNPLTIHGDGSQKRVFCHVSDAVSGIMSLWNAPDGWGEAFNVGGFEETTILELATKIIELCDSRSNIKFVSYDSLKKTGFEDMGRRVPSTSKLHALSGWKPKVSLDEILLSYLNSIRIKS